MSSNLILWAIVIGYVLFVFTKGVSKVTKVNSADDFLVAGRNIGWFFLACTMGATIIGGGASIGAIARTYEWGVLMLLVSAGWYVHFIFAGTWVAPHFRRARLYTVAGYFGHRFGENPRFFVMILSLLFSVFIVAAQMAAFGSVMSAILPQFSNAQTILRLAIIIGGTMVVIYSTAGGLLAVIHTDVYQFIILLLGFFITLGFCVPDIFNSYDATTGSFTPARFSSQDITDAPLLAAGLDNTDNALAVYIRQHDQSPTSTKDKPAQDTRNQPAAMADTLNQVLDDPHLYTPERFAGIELNEQAQEMLQEDQQGRKLRRLNLALLQCAYPEAINPQRTIPKNFFIPHGGKGWIFLVTTFMAFLLGEAFAPGYATRYCVGKDIRETRWGIAGVGVFLALVFPAVLLFIALYARIHFPDVDSQQVLPLVVRQLNNPVVGGLIIGALLMAVMSSADSALNSATAIFVKDLFEHHLGWQDTGDGRLLKLARICSAGLGAAAILVAVLWSDIIGLLLFTYHVWAPAIIVPVCVGVFSKKRSHRQTVIILATMIIATIGTIIYRLPLMLYNNFEIEIISPRNRGFIETFDPAVFGVLLSLVAFLLLSVTARILRGPAVGRPTDSIAA